MNYKELFFAFFFFISASTVLCIREFYPDWSNCNENTQIEFIDFFFDHKPSINHAVNTVTFCAGAGKEIPIGSVNIVIMSQDSNKSMNETYPGLSSVRFTNGMYNRCLQAGILEFTEPGIYNLTLSIRNEDESGLTIGCLGATGKLIIKPRLCNEITDC